MYKKTPSDDTLGAVIAPPRAYSYIRFSTPDQLKGDSLRRQLDKSTAYAKQHGLDLDEKLTFRDLGISAFDKSNLGARADLRAFLDAVDQARIPPGSYLLVESLDRLTRAHIFDALRLFLEILTKGITIVTLVDGMKYTRDSGDPNKDFSSLIISLTIMSRAHEESATKSDRLREAWSAKRRDIHKRKLTSQCPKWLRLNDDGTEYEFVPERVALVRQIIELVRGGQGKSAIAKRLNEQGIPSFGGRGKSGNWFESYITKIIKSRALIGEFQPGQVLNGKRVPVGEPVSEYFPRVLSDEEFALLQDLISERGLRSGGNRGRGFSNLFMGLVRCGYCGGSMIYVDKGVDKRRKKPSGSNRFLVCSRAKRGAGCVYVPWTYGEFEDAFFQYAGKVDFERFVSSSGQSRSDLQRLAEEVVILRAKQVDLKQKQARLVDAIADAELEPKGVLDRLVQIDAQLNGCEARMHEIEAQRQSLESHEQMSTQAIEALRRVAESLRNLQEEERFLFRARLNEYMRRVLDRIILFPGGTIHTSAEIEVIQRELEAAGHYSQSEIDDYVARFLQTEPQRHERYFAIRNRDGIIHAISPGERIPDIIAFLEGKQDLWIDAMKRANELLGRAIAA